MKALCGSKSSASTWARKKVRGLPALMARILPDADFQVWRGTFLKQRSYPPRAPSVSGAFLALSLALGASAHAAPAIDKEAHFLATYGLTLSVAELAEGKFDHPELIGFGAGLAVGVLKELCDSEFSVGDLNADLLGAITGALFHYSVRF